MPSSYDVVDRRPETENSDEFSLPGDGAAAIQLAAGHPSPPDLFSIVRRQFDDLNLKISIRLPFFAYMPLKFSMY